MRLFALTLLGCAVLVTVGCSSSRSFSRKAVMADHIASVCPDGSSYAPATRSAHANTTHARRAAPTTVTYVSTPSRSVNTTAYAVPAPPPPPAMPGVTRAPVRSVAPAAARPVARPVAPVRRAPAAVECCDPCDPCAPRPRVANPFNKLFGGCPGGT